MSRNRNWRITINNPSEDDDKLFDRLFEQGKISYAVWQYEKGEQTGTLHIEAYAEGTTAISLRTAKRVFGNRAHLKPRDMSQQDAIDYCTKVRTRERGPFSIGATKKQGERTDTKGLCDALLEGKKAKHLAMDPKYAIVLLKYPRGAQFLERAITERNLARWRRVAVFVFIGTTGSGKTRNAIGDGSTGYFTLCKGNSGNAWFSAYAGEQRLVIDDFYGWLSWGFLLRVLDGHTLCCETKGDHVWAEWTEVIITSNALPRNWYSPDKVTDDMFTALQRRINVICHFD